MTLVFEPDYGTPAAPADETVTVQVDGVDVTVPKGTSVMRAAAEAGLSVVLLERPP